jgi:NRPS condensation-like uncharacterized protein
MKATKAPTRYPATPLDGMLDIARFLHDGQGRWVLTFSGRLDPERLARAIELSFDAEPVLGCRFVAHPWRPYWERLPHEQRASAFSIVKTEDGINAWMRTSLDASRDVQIQACLFRGPEEKLAFKLSHDAGDSSGMLDYLSLVSRIYRELGSNPAYVPPPQAGRIGQGPILRNVGLRRLLRGWRHYSYADPGVDSPIEVPRGVPVFASRRVEPEDFARIREYCRAHGVTVHEVIFAAFYRSQYRVLAPPPAAVLTLPIPMDLRRFLPSGTECGICNLSVVYFAGVRNQSFDQVVLDVHRLMASARSNEPWLGQSVLIQLAFLLPYGVVRRIARRSVSRQVATGRIHPYISNFGIIDLRRFDFGDAVPCNVEQFPLLPNHYVPIYSVQTVGNVLTVTISTWDEPDGRKAERLLDAYVRELPGQASPAIS